MATVHQVYSGEYRIEGEVRLQSYRRRCVGSVWIQGVRRGDSRVVKGLGWDGSRINDRNSYDLQKAFFLAHPLQPIHNNPKVEHVVSTAE